MADTEIDTDRDTASDTDRVSDRGIAAFADLPTTTLADLLGRAQVMDIGIRPLWGPVPRVAGPAFTVRCPPGDNLMLHAAVYRAEPGSVVVVESGDLDYALAGGNVCAVAQRRGVAAFVADGLIRDLAEVREAGFPVFARGVIPIPGTKSAVRPLGERVRCGGVSVSPGDVVVADEEGVVVVPGDRRAEILAGARDKLAKEAAESLDDWEAAHRARIERTLAEGGFEG
ncbi:RraA family protein [Streptomyces sp. NPDC052682]|uniref:RraA family protein n=1 Tax=Streptomyces sp. NPDC052682 TaxID=3154954 RepID=UPI0034404649